MHSPDLHSRVFGETFSDYGETFSDFGSETFSHLLKALYPLGGNLSALKTGRARGFGLFGPEEEGRCLTGYSIRSFEF